MDTDMVREEAVVNALSIKNSNIKGSMLNDEIRAPIVCIHMHSVFVYTYTLI